MDKYGRSGDRALLFPSHACASRCQEFILSQAPDLTPKEIHVIDLVPTAEKARSEELSLISPKISAAVFPQDLFPIAKAFWQHSGDGISSRRAEYCHDLFSKNLLIDRTKLEELNRSCKGPRPYRKNTSIDISNGAGTGSGEVRDPTLYVEERFGRNLDISLTTNAKLAVRRRIAGSLTENVALHDALNLEKDAARTRKVADFTEDDVYLYPCGMSSIYNTHRIMMAAKGQMKSIVYG